MDDGEYPTRREQIGGKKRKKEENRPKGAGEKQEASKRGRGRGGRGKAAAKAKAPGRGRGSGRGRGKVMKRPSARAEPSQAAEDDQEQEEEEDKEEDECVEEGCGSSPSCSACPEASTSKRLCRSMPLQEESENDKGDGKPKVKAKATPKAKAKAKTRAAVAAERVTEHEWEPELREEILACLDECKAAGEMGGKEKHTHRSTPPLDDFATFSIYWSRFAVGVKVRQSVADKWIQVAYFARDTPCVLTNYMLARRWVPC